MHISDMVTEDMTGTIATDLIIMETKKTVAADGFSDQIEDLTEDLSIPDRTINLFLREFQLDRLDQYLQVQMVLFTITTLRVED